ncbi:MAG: universal stress protein [Methanoregulaceae archaeon]
MFRKVLVAVDGSAISDTAFTTAVDIARNLKATVHVVYVVETGFFSALPMDNTWEMMYSLLEKEGKEALAKAREYAQKSGVEIVTHLKQGHAGNEIIRTGEEAGVDLIIVGSHGKSKVDRLLIGSVSSFVVSHSPITTMVVRA